MLTAPWLLLCVPMCVSVCVPTMQHKMSIATKKHWDEVRAEGGTSGFMGKQHTAATKVSSYLTRYQLW